MLTILHVEPTGHETILQTKRVTSHPGPQIQGGERSIYWERDDGSTVAIETGTVYVMNDNGKTVAKYHLEIGPAPLAPVQPTRDTASRTA